MTDFAKEIENILEKDPLGLLIIRPKAAPIGADERLATSFREINTFVQQLGREPTESRDINERRLFSRLKGLRENPVKAAALREHDEHGLLADVPLLQDMATPEDILEHDPLGLIGNNDDPNDIFNLRNVPKQIAKPDKVARRRPCSDFEKYEALFQQTHAELRKGTKALVRFEGETQFNAGDLFVLNGVMLFVESIGEKEKKGRRTNARLHCVFENGTESNMLQRSLARELSKDELGRRIVNPFLAPEQEATEITDDDQVAGYIYILRSKSDDPKIAEIDNLFKIGFSKQPASQRIKNAKNEPTYLMADVEVFAEFQAYNLNPQKLELLVHKFFAKSCVNFDVYDNHGKRHTPREWFVVPFNAIESAINLLITGNIVDYRYDERSEQIIKA